MPLSLEIRCWEANEGLEWRLKSWDEFPTAEIGLETIVEADVEDAITLDWVVVAGVQLPEVRYTGA